MFKQVSSEHDSKCHFKTIRLEKIKYSIKMMVAYGENITKLPLSSMEIGQEDFQVLLRRTLWYLLLP